MAGLQMPRGRRHALMHPSPSRNNFLRLGAHLRDTDGRLYRFPTAHDSGTDAIGAGDRDRALWFCVPTSEKRRGVRAPEPGTFITFLSITGKRVYGVVCVDAVFSRASGLTGTLFVFGSTPELSAARARRFGATSDRAADAPSLPAV